MGIERTALAFGMQNPEVTSVQNLHRFAESPMHTVWPDFEGRLKGLIAFGDTYHTKGLDAAISSFNDTQGLPVVFGIPVPGKGFSTYFGEADQKEGLLMGIVGVETIIYPDQPSLHRLLSIVRSTDRSQQTIYVPVHSYPPGTHHLSSKFFQADFQTMTDRMRVERIFPRFNSGVAS